MVRKQVLLAPAHSRESFLEKIKSEYNSEETDI